MSPLDPLRFQPRIVPIEANRALELAAPTEAERDAWVAAIRRARHRAASESAGGGCAADGAAAALDDPVAVAATPPAATDKHGAPDGGGAPNDGGGGDGEGQEEGAAGHGSEYVFDDWAQYDDGRGRGSSTAEAAARQRQQHGRRRRLRECRAVRPSHVDVRDRYVRVAKMPQFLIATRPPRHRFDPRPASRRRPLS